MGAKYSVLKVVTVTGTIFSIYNAFTDSLLLEDLIIALLVAVLLLAVTQDLHKSRTRTTKIEKSIENALEETVKNQLAGN